MRSVQKTPNHALTDDQAKEVIRSHLSGYAYRELADRTGYSEGTIRGICEGTNRGHLLMQVEREPKRMIG